MFNYNEHPIKVLSVDIAPANKNVLRCDFTSFRLADKYKTSNHATFGGEVVDTLVEGYYDQICFLYLLRNGSSKLSKL